MGNDRHLVQRVKVLQVVVQQGVASLMVSSRKFLVIRHGEALAGHSEQYLVAGLLHVVHRDGQLSFTGCEKGGLVAEVGQISPATACGPAGDALEVDGRFQLQRLAVDAQDGDTLVDVGQVHRHLTVKAPRAKQCRVKDIRPVGGRHDNDGTPAVKPIHLHQDLVQSLLAFVVAAAKPASAVAADGIQLVDEQDAGIVAAGSVEQIAHTRGAHADEHLDKIGPTGMEEGDSALTGYRLCKQRLAGSRRTDQQHATGNFGSHFGEVVGMFEELDHLLQLVLGLGLPCDIVKSHLVAVVLVLLCVALAQVAHHPAVDAAGLPVEHDSKADEDDPRQQL